MSTPTNTTYKRKCVLFQTEFLYSELKVVVFYLFITTPTKTSTRRKTVKRKESKKQSANNIFYGYVIDFKRKK